MTIKAKPKGLLRVGLPAFLLVCIVLILASRTQRLPGYLAPGPKDEPTYSHREVQQAEEQVPAIREIMAPGTSAIAVQLQLIDGSLLPDAAGTLSYRFSDSCVACVPGGQTATSKSGLFMLDASMEKDPCWLHVRGLEVSDTTLWVVDTVVPIAEGAELLTIRVAYGPMISAFYAQSGALVEEVVVCADSLLDGAPTPSRWPLPPQPLSKADGTVDTLPGTFALERIQQMRGPCMGGAGLAWRSIPKEVLRQGGSVAVFEGASLDIRLACNAALDEVELVALSGSGVLTGTPAYSIQLGAGIDGTSSHLLHGLLPGDYTLLAVARVGPGSNARSSPVSISLRPGQLATAELRLSAEERVVDIYVDTASGPVSDFQAIRLQNLNPASASLAFPGIKLDKGAQLELVDEHVWLGRSIRLPEGSYLATLEPLAIYVPFKVSSESASSLISLVVPEQVSIRVRLVDEQGILIAEPARYQIQCALTEHAFEAPPVSMTPFQASASVSGFSVFAPQGSWIRLRVVTESGASGGLEDLCAGQPEMDVVVKRVASSRSLTLSLFDGQDPIRLPGTWWNSGISARNATGLRSSVVIRWPESLVNSIDLASPWSFAAGSDELFHSLTIVVPGDATELLLPLECGPNQFYPLALPPDTTQLVVRSSGVSWELSSSPLAPETTPEVMGGVQRR